MKKLSVMMAFALSAVLLMGCGREKAEENPAGADTAGNAIIVNDVPQATEEMNEENSSAQTEEPAEELVVDPEQLEEPEIVPQEVTEVVPEAPVQNRLQIVFLEIGRAHV